ncbi:VPLPA-CTERM-specific exosortase XrtD [Thioclava atlantica]|uniref:Transmembrane exosortase n=1 Tax=Thioclava atlantica TaxID=1317124 RepID=A0A085TUK6_9RHOB|nr:VPLPA-CTERM-specific exosortase XrtD [Thioclava atlantica]KFE34403.1 transmembrane exosortase [Thioclava atlantica]
MSTTSTNLRAVRALPWGALGLIALAAASAPVFALGLRSLGAAWSTPEYSHGPVIPLISLYLFARELHRAPPATARPARRWPGLAVLALGFAIAGFGNLAQIADIVTYGLIVWVMGVVLLSMGWDAGRRHWKPVLHLIFMLPLPQILYWKLTIFLQFVSSNLGVALVRLADIPVYLEGNVIDLGVFKLQVAEACSGLRYLFPILSFSYLFGILYRGPFWHKAVLFAMAAPLTVLLNALRIGVVAILVNAYGIGQAEGFLHVFEGWAIFGAAIATLSLAAIMLQRLTPDPLPLPEALDLDYRRFAPEARRVLSLAPSRMLLAAIGLALLASTALTSLPGLRTELPHRLSFADFPGRIDDWNGERRPLDPETEAVLGASDYLNTVYADRAREHAVNLFVAWYADQSNGEGIHSPDVCLPAGGWEVSAFAPHRLALPGRAAFTVNRAIISKGLSRSLVYYWFDERGVPMTSDWRAKLSVILDGAMRGRTDGALVRYVTPIARDEEIEGADARLTRFIASSLPRLDAYIPD